jgi:DNA-binding transcriptional LysR family regulator
VKLSAIDLNVLVALDAVFSERNVTRAAAQIGRSQPALSHALQRARALFDDPLLVRVQGTLELTARARSIAPEIHRLLGELSRVLDAQQTFDPHTLDSVTLGATDYVGFVLLPHVFRILTELAPGLSVRVRALEGPDAIEPLSRGALDIALGTFPFVPKSLRQQRLFDDHFVCLRRKRRAGTTHMTLERFASLGHVLVTSPSAGPGPVDYALAERGLTRKIAAYVPHFLVAPSIVAATDLVLTTGQRVAERFAPQLGLETFPCPVHLERFAVSMIWHPRTDDDSMGRWLREILRSATSNLSAPPPRTRAKSKRERLKRTNSPEKVRQR